MTHKKFLIMLILLCSVYVINILGSDYKTLNNNDTVLVIDVIDANALLVKTTTGEEALVRVLGIDASKTNEAKSYVENLIENQFITVKKDSMYPSLKGRWNYMHVYFNEAINGRVSLGETLLNTGLAVIDGSTLTNEIKVTYNNSEDLAKNQNYGIWYDDNAYYNNYKSEEAININTSTKSEITSMLKYVFGSDYSNYDYIESAIIDYRNENIFNTIDELKFVDDITKSDYDDLKYYFNVTTDLRTAGLRELQSLNHISESDAERIQKYMSENMKATFETLYDENIITKSEYNDNKAYISSTPDDERLLPEPNYVVNVNTASVDQLKDTGISNSVAKQIVSARESSGFTFKNVTEIYEHGKISISRDYINEYEDNLTFVTNVNTATTNEIESLFGDDYESVVVSTILSNRDFSDDADLKKVLSVDDYNKISKHIKFNNNNITYVNINTVNKSTLTELNFDEDAISWILKYQDRIDDMRDLDEEVLEYDNKFTIYTNINKATSTEILSLSNEISSTIANSIVRDASREMFAHIDELEDIFNSYGLEDEFDEFKDFIVFR